QQIRAKVTVDRTIARWPEHTDTVLSLAGSRVISAARTAWGWSARPTGVGAPGLRQRPHRPGPRTARRTGPTTGPAQLQTGLPRRPAAAPRREARCSGSTRPPSFPGQAPRTAGARR